MQNYEKLSRKYKYRMKQKYQEDPFAFIVLWSLFFSAVFMIFAFRGLIAATFMSKIDVSNEITQNEINNEINNTVNITADNSTANSTPDNSDNTVNGDTTANEQTNTIQNTLE